MSFHLSLEPRSAIRFVQNYFCAYGTIGTNHKPILHRNEISHDPRHPGVPSAAFEMISNPMVRSAQTVHLSCIMISTISYGLNRASTWASTWSSQPRSAIRCIQKDLSASTWASQPRSVVGCIQNDFWAYDLFGAKHSPILHWHKHCLPKSASQCVQNGFWGDGTFGPNRARLLRQDLHYLQTD
jgi:hypothetical protein